MTCNLSSNLILIKKIQYKRQNNTKIYIYTQDVYYFRLYKHKTSIFMILSQHTKRFKQENRQQTIEMS